MNSSQWNAFCSFRDDFKTQIAMWNNKIKAVKLDQWLALKQQELARADKVPDYPIETPLVYNTALDEITPSDDIKLIVIGDNPGKDEQLAKNRRYLVGQSGKIAAGFFRRNSQLGIDFRKNAIILNKTPIHTAKTKELKKLIAQPKKTSKLETSDVSKATSELSTTDLSKAISELNTTDLSKGSSGLNAPAFFADLLLESQIWMATHTAKLHKALCQACQSEHTDTSDIATCQLWLVGYGELKNKGIFVPYGKTLAQSFQYTSQNTSTHASDIACANSVFVFQHFSMNRFLIDLRAHTNPELSLQQNIKNVGRMHRKEILSF